MKVKTLAAAVCVAITAASCGETTSKKPDTPVQETPEQIKKAEKAIKDLDATIQEIDSKEADLDAALEELDF